MITQITSLRDSDSVVTLRLSGAVDDITATLQPGQSVHVLVESLTYSAATVAAGADAVQAAYITDAGPILGTLQRPGTLDPVAAGVWVLVFLLVIRMSRVF